MICQPTKIFRIKEYKKKHENSISCFKNVKIAVPSLIDDGVHLVIIAEIYCLHTTYTISIDSNTKKSHF